MGVTNLKSEISLRYPPAPSDDRKLLFEPAKALTQESGKCQPFSIIMGSGRLGQRFFGKTPLPRKLINDKLLLKPTFHYSTIPWPRPLAQTWL
jgi:hypothetical protein